MGNKVKYNLKNVHAAKLTETVTEGRGPSPARSASVWTRRGNPVRFTRMALYISVRQPTTVIPAIWKLH